MRRHVGGNGARANAHVRTEVMDQPRESFRARAHTGESVQYAPPSTINSISIARSFPAFETAVLCRVREGCRFVVATISSARS
jgi:hypothetical protein